MEYIYGRNGVLEALKGGDIVINKVLVQKDLKAKVINDIIALCREQGIVFQFVEKAKLFTITEENHQGVIAYVSPFKYYDLKNIASERKKDSVVVVLDGITDPHNFGAIMRSAYAFGADGIIIPKRRSVSITATAVKASAGAASHIKVAKVTNITNTLSELKRMGYWIIGTDAKSKENVYKSDLTGKVALIIGSEGEGMSQRVKKACDKLVSIPMANPMESLNASVSAGILVFEAYKQRLK